MSGPEQRAGAAARRHIAVEALGEFRPPHVRHRAPEHWRSGKVRRTQRDEIHKGHACDRADTRTSATASAEEHRRRTASTPATTGGRAACARRATSRWAAAPRNTPARVNRMRVELHARLRAPALRGSDAACSSRTAGRNSPRPPPTRRAARPGQPDAARVTAAISVSRRRCGFSPCASRSANAEPFSISQRCNISQAGM